MGLLHVGHGRHPSCTHIPILFITLQGRAVPFHFIYEETGKVKGLARKYRGESGAVGEGGPAVGLQMKLAPGAVGALSGLGP